MRRRWQALTLTAPIHQLVRNIAHIDLDAESYDTRQLALNTIDAVVSEMGSGREITLESAIDLVTVHAQQMNPYAEDSSEPARVAVAVVSNLLNTNDGNKSFTYRFADMAVRANAWTDYSFRLLQLRETERGDVLVASDEAVLLYVAALDADLEDAETAHAVMLRRQLDDGRLDAAETSAAHALRTSEGFSAALQQMLRDTVRDVSTHDWHVDVPARLDRARAHIDERLADGSSLQQHLRQGLDGDLDPDLRASSGRILALLDRGRDLHLVVNKSVTVARSVWIDAHTRQKLAARTRLRLMSLPENLLQPVLGLTEADADVVTSLFADHVIGPAQPRLATVASMMDLLWSAPRAIDEAPDADPEPEFIDEATDFDAYAPHVTAAVQAALEPAWSRPTRVSQMLSVLDDDQDLAASGDPQAHEAAIELLTLSALWAFDPAAVTEDEDEDAPAIGTRAAVQPEAGRPDDIAFGLEAVRDGAQLMHKWAYGDDLLLATSELLAGLADPQPQDDELAAPKVTPSGATVGERR